MNFFEAQDRARKQSRRLLLSFALAVAAVVIAVDVALLLAFGTDFGSAGLALRWEPWSAPMLSLLASGAIATLLLIALSSLVKIASLRDGGSAVARMLGGTPVPARSNDLALQRLRGVVEEMAIASGVPVPSLFVLETEEGINAFAAGYSSTDAAIAVTRGALQALTRDELQGVVAHEYSHILNGDMRLNLRLMGWLFGILVLTIGARKVLAHSDVFRKSKGAPLVFILALALLIIGSVGLFGARAIKAALSRQREFLADASAVQFTRQTEGLIGALRKISGTVKGSKLDNVEAEEISHMLFGDGVGFSRLMATHPPLADRIRALDPYRRTAAGNLGASVPMAAVGSSGSASELVSSAAPAPLPEAFRVQSKRVPTQVGNPGADDYKLADRLQRSIPDDLHDAAEDPQRAQAVVLALLLSEQSARSERQNMAIAEVLGADTLASVLEFTHACAQLHPAMRLPLAHLAIPALRQRPPSSRQKLRSCVALLAVGNDQQSLFEYCLRRLLRVLLDESERPPRIDANGRLIRLFHESCELLMVLAQHGHADPKQAKRAYLAGAEILGLGRAPDYQAHSDWAQVLNRILPRLDRLRPQGKALLLEAMFETSSHDGRMRVAEAELLRTLGASLHMPLPAQLGEAVA